MADISTRERDRRRLRSLAREHGVTESACVQAVMRAVVECSTAADPSPEARLTVRLPDKITSGLSELAAGASVASRTLQRLLLDAATGGELWQLMKIAAELDPSELGLSESTDHDATDEWPHPSTWTIAESAVQAWAQARASAGARSGRGSGRVSKAGREKARKELPTLVERIVFTASDEWRDPVGYDDEDRAEWRGTRRAHQARMVVDPGAPPTVLWVGMGAPPDWCWRIE